MPNYIFSRLLQHGTIPIRSHPAGLRWRHALLVASTLSFHPVFTLGFCRPYQSRTVVSCSSVKNLSPIVGNDGHYRTTKRFLSKNQSDDEILSDSSSTSIQDPREFILSKCPEPIDREIILQTLDWVQNVVIGLNFCPFAEKPYRSKQMHLEVIHGIDESEILALVLGECLVRQTNPGTSLMICPDLYPTKFDTFLQVYNLLNDGVLVDHDLTDDVQIAPFHPMFEFEGSGSDGVDNYTNRSPYPIFHILREEEVGRAVDLLDGDASKVWRRNVKLLEALGDELQKTQLEQIMSGKTVDPTIQEKVKSILRDLKKRTKDIV